MKKSKQAGKYILSDFISASIAWLLFNILRYEVLFVINEGTDSLLDYLQYPGVLTGQFVIPFFWLVLYYFSGYYNKPFGKSRLTELFSTFITVLIGTIFVFFALLLGNIVEQQSKEDENRPIHYRTDWDDFRLLCFAARRYSPVDQCLL